MAVDPTYLDCANHKNSASGEDIKKLCADVLTYRFNSAFVNPCYVALAHGLLAGKGKVGTVISFPLGADTTAVKLAGVSDALVSGADELDVVPNLGWFLEGKEDAFISEMREIVEAVRLSGRNIIVKFILEPGSFDSLPDTKERMQKMASLIQASGADFVKIGSGMGPRGPELSDVAIVREAVGETMRIKVAGGITKREQAEAFIAAGANRIGTSHAIEIYKG